MILDASAVLALLNDEPGADEVQHIIGHSRVCAVNVAEVAGKLADHGMLDKQIAAVLAIGFDTLPFGDDEIALIPRICKATKTLGLSLGDWCSLAAALAHGEPVLTADRAWAKVKIRGLKIVVLSDRQ